MSNFISGLSNKVSELEGNFGINGGAFGNNSQPAQYQSQQNPSSDPRDVSKGLEEASSAYRSFNKARQADKRQEHEADGGKQNKSSMKKISRFFKSLIGYESAAMKAGKAAEELTGQNLQQPFGNQQNAN
jgi:hypothetical protein